MSRITVNAQTCAQLSQATDPVEVYDEGGRFLGRFVPPFDHSQFEYIVPPPSDEELQRRINSGGPYLTLNELLARVGLS